MKYFGKRGSHVGIVISFNIFILFLLSIFLLINPVLKERGEKQSVLDSLPQKILENVSSNITLTMIRISDTYSPGSSTCIEISGGGWNPGDSIAVRNTSQRVSSVFGSSLISIPWNPGNKLLKIYSSSEVFEPQSFSPSGCATLLEGTNFFIRYIKTEKYIFEPNIIKLKESYDNSYEDLKNELGIPPEEDFGFSFINSNGVSVIEAGEVPSSLSIYSKKNYVTYVNNKSDILPGIIIVKAW
jgi:hypothetical protein